MAFWRAPKARREEESARGGEMHPTFAGGGSQGAVVDLGMSAGDAHELGSGFGEGLEADQSGLGPTGAGVDGELSLVGADIDDGGEGVASEGGVVVQGSGHAVQQRGPAGGGLQELGVFAQTGRHAVIPCSRLSNCEAVAGASMVTNPDGPQQRVT